MQFSVHVPDNKAAVFLRMTKRIKFVKILPETAYEEPSPEQLKSEIKEAVREVKQAKKGQTQLPTLNQFLNEL